MSTAYVTGTNDDLFWNACLLLQSFRAYEPHARLDICDFGLTSAQASFLRAKGALRPRPEPLRDLPHPWYLKASLVDYLPEAAANGVMVWLDADMFLVRGISQGVERVAGELHETRRLAAACVDAAGLSLGGFVERFAGEGQPLSPTRAAMEALGVEPSRPYLNSGFIVSRSPGFWSAWKSITLSMPPHFLFEQNAFNLLVQGTRAGAHLLDAREWNVHGPLLKELPDPIDAGPARVVHATSDGSEHEYADVVQATNHGTVICRLKTLRRPALRRRQFDLLASFVHIEADALAEAGLIPSP
jgi:hypothetical protein